MPAAMCMAKSSDCISYEHALSLSLLASARLTVSRAVNGFLCCISFRTFKACADVGREMLVKQALFQARAAKH